MIKAIISDADGTLVNTLFLIRHGQYEAAVKYLKELKVPLLNIPTYEEYLTQLNKSVGGPTRDTFEKTLHAIYEKTNPEYLSQINFDVLDKNLTPVQDHIAPLYVHPFPGLTELFTWTGKSNISFGIFTSGNRRMVIRNFGVSLPVLGYMDLYHMEDLSLTERFQAFISRAEAVYGMPKLAVVTCDDIAKPKPNPEGILRLMEELSVTEDEVIILGDLPVDMLAAQAAKAHAIGITHGFGTSEELKASGALCTVDDLTSLSDLIDAHNRGEALLF